MRKGFTLIEVIIAILVLSMSTLVVIAMQTSALRGYSSIRDTDDAVMIAHRTADLLHIEAASWRENGANPWSFNVNDSYAGQTPFDVSNVLNAVNTTQWTWIPLFNNPVNERMANSSTTTGRHCVYVRGGPFSGSLTKTVDASGVIQSSPAMSIQIAVVSSGVRNNMSDCVNPSSNKPPYSLAQLGFTATDQIPLGWSLESNGYRPTYHATVVFKRNFL